MKNNLPTISATASMNFGMDDLDLTELIGQPVTLYSKQFPGKALSNKVISATNRELQLQPEGAFDGMSNLVNSQLVVIQLPYKGEWISVRATLKKSDGGRCNFTLQEQVVPLSQRKYVRICNNSEVQLATFSMQTIAQKPINKLTWIKTKTASFSSGGALVEVPGHVETGLIMLLNIDIELDDFPAMVLAEVIYCFENENGKRMAGVEFMVSEVARKRYSSAIIKQLPKLVLKYTAPVREKVNRLIRADLEDSGSL